MRPSHAALLQTQALSFCTNHSIRIAVVGTGLACFFLQTLVCPPAANAQPQSHSTRRLGVGEADWTVLDQRQGRGEQCLVCGKQMFGTDVVEVRLKGRTFHVAAGMMLERFEQDPKQYFRKLQARSALFDESSIPPKQMSLFWLGLGSYVLTGLICGAACAYLAVAKGLPVVQWFAAGLIGNVIVLAAVRGAKTRRDPSAPAGIPPGLAKVPTTRSPKPCGACGHENHPSAAACSGCGIKLDPTVRSEVALA